MANDFGKSVSDMTSLDPSKVKDGSDAKLFSPNAQEDPETVTGDNPLVAWKPGGSKPSGPFGPQGKMF